ncbi:lipocalin family protein [Subsaximicrobium wynnwilliamsii]|uniref:Lipocalin family protein n=1 Tax=Subsaximicrobium wynnwilliamsii TaxID=291179 RepID=A0A5C6ZHF4_9FLAO|nr:lipocalin family protein [Subsaximicrobium wynnwilliamsii]TXD82897.1 lipocalin family protein [Subsaximicrobium wynnwilliamsii]TXD88619.1 lipocalin family protein [Subsaximicrobium wynnwilliamsii]TXE02711.1 lipocalin family protein [Subsaximicrobium wynnwilliamsii]
MKKLILLLTAVTLTFTSCSSDDDNPPIQEVEEDAFVGVWSLSKALLNDNELPIDDCDVQSNFTIKSNGTFVESSYTTTAAGTCESDFADAGTWENLGNNTYKLKYDADEDGDTYQEDVAVNTESFSIFYDDPYIYVFTKN